MTTNDPGLWGLVASAIAAGGAWVAGEGGRIAVAGGAGGLARWLNSRTRTIRDGMISVGGGLLAGTYLWPAVLFVMGLPSGPIPETPNTIAMAAFIAGTMGMSLVKIITAMVEARALGGKNEER